ncbi:unnamed protein product [Ranitomeya imitator]|uniref:Uncharacterized protein n=1 Tax=Ranitomeya imitator TaxID=111125 RepID=A0ABN9LJR4_9NEOB|nr:unnamed protein product [Ranitomeya imitator]
MRRGSGSRKRHLQSQNSVTGRDMLVYNISSYNLSPPELTVLQKGLSFCPTPSFREFQLDQELQRFFRNLRLKAHFATVDSGAVHSSSISVSDRSVFSLKELNLALSSNYNPPKTYHPVETYISFVSHDIQSKCALINQGLLSIKRNCTPIEKRALEDLKSNKSITIKPADKGGAVVVMDTSFYISMVRQHLDDVNTYMPVDRDPTREITQEIKQIVDSFKEQNVIDSKLAEYLINKHPVVPVFYALPKIHKHQTLPPGRPIVASTDSLLAPLAKTVEKILTPLLGNIVSFIKDTPDFLDGLNSLGTLCWDRYGVKYGATLRQYLYGFFRGKLRVYPSLVPETFVVLEEVHR